MNVTFYKFAKRNNSTKIVNVTGTTLTCELKGQTSIVSPSLIINSVPAAWNPMWNYCYIPAFDRYYFINNWTWLNGVWECETVCDVLASFKTAIGNMSEYVMRSSAESDGLIEDSAYLAKAQVSTNMQQLPEFYVRAMTAGFYVVGIIGKDSTATQGAITYYQMTPAEMARLREYMLSDTFLTDQGLRNLTDFVPADATKVIYNPYQYIVSCQWFPFPVSAIDAAFKTAVSTINFGWWNTGTGFTAYRINANAPVYTRSEDISIPSHPQISRGAYLNHAPYTIRILRMTPFNEVQIPDQYLETGDHITIELQCDFITGMAALLIYAKTSNNVVKMLITRQTVKLGVDIQLAQVGADFLGARTEFRNQAYGLVEGIKGSLSKVDLSSYWAAVGSTGLAIADSLIQKDIYDINSLNSYMKAAAPQLLTSGSNGSMLMFAQNNYMCTTFYIITDEDNAQLGKPLCKIRTLNTIPGYITVMNPDVSLSCFEAERSLIIQFLTSGFFYE